MQSAICNPANTNPYAVFPPVTQAGDCDITDQPIVLQGELGLGQLQRAGRLCARSQVRRNRPLVMAALLFLSLAGSGYGLWFNQPQLAIGVSFQSAAAALVLLAITCMDGSTMLKFNFLIGLQRPERFGCTVSQSGVRTVFSRLMLDDPWSRFSGFSESDDMVVLWRMSQYIPLPKEFSAGEGEWERLRDFLHDRLPVRRS